MWSSNARALPNRKPKYITSADLPKMVSKEIKMEKCMRCGEYTCVENQGKMDDGRIFYLCSDCEFAIFGVDDK